MAAWSREPSGVLKAREVSAPPSLRVPVGAGREQLMGGGAAEPRELLGGKKPEGGPHPSGWAPEVRAAAGRPPPPPPLAPWLFVPLPRLLQSEPPRQGPRSLGRARLDGSLSPLARPVLPRQGKGVPLPLPADRL